MPAEPKRALNSGVCAASQAGGTVDPMPTKASAAAQELAAALRDEGFSRARATQVQGWIDADWIPNELRYPGGGGSEVVLGPDAYEIAALISCLPRDQRNTNNVVLARYIRGLPITEAEIQPALSAVVEHLYTESGMTDVVGADEDTVIETAEAKASAELARRRRGRTFKAMEPGLRAWAEAKGDEYAAYSNTELLQAALVPFLAAIGGQIDELDAGMEPLAAGAGLMPLMEAASAPGFRPEDQLDNAAKRMRLVLEGWHEVPSDVTLEELAEARKMQIAIFAVMGQDLAVDVIEGRARRDWDTLITSFVGACLAWVVSARHGLFPDDLMARLQEGIDARRQAANAAPAPDEPE